MKGMTPDDLYELTGAADPRVSPDGSAVAYVVTGIDRETNTSACAIWCIPLEGGAPAKQLTAGRKLDASPRWSPDGTRIAFTSTRDGDTADLYVIPVDGGEAIRLTEFEKEGVGEPAWSPDGARIAFTARVRHADYNEDDDRKRRPRRFTRLIFKMDNEGWIADRPKHVFVVAADGSSPPEQLTDGDFDHGSPAWSPDGRRLAATASRHDTWDIHPASDIYLFPSGGGAPELLTVTDGSCAMPSWSPDGSVIAYYYTPGIFDDPRHAQVAVTDLATRQRRILTEVLDRNCAPYPAAREPIWQGDRILFAVEDAGNTPLCIVPADGSDKPAGVVGGEFVIGGYDLVAGKGVHTASEPNKLPELFFGPEQLTRLGDAFAAAHDLPGVERFTVTSSGGAEVDAWIMRPAGFEPGKRYPVLLNIHGGPFTQYGNRFFDEFQVYAGAGYVVLFCNPRGSSGYSEEWGRAIRGPGEAGPGMGSVDYDDVMAVTDEALRRFDFCDPERLGVMGGSYGGYMTSWIVSHTDRFAAGVSERAVNSWVSMWGSSDVGWSFKGYVGADVLTDHDAWRAMSPLTYAQNIRTPLLILHSENDLRCNIEQAEQLFTTLRLLEREVELVRFPAESHELSRSGSPAHRVMRFEIILDWFARHLNS